MRRRLFALVVLGATIFSSAESALALSSDGRLHQETVRASGAQHDVGIAPEAGREEKSPADGDRQHEGSHRHGTLADHCTHGHAVGPVAFTRWAAAPLAHADAIPSFVASYTDADPRHALRPPRA